MPKTPEARIILASTSPRRKELLANFSLPFAQMDSCFDESLVSFQGDPEIYATTLALKKGLCLQKKILDQDAIIISADTVVFFDNTIFNKPKDLEEALSMLRRLNGNTHKVISGISVIQGEHTVTTAEQTLITFNNVSDKTLQKYVATQSVLDKCGAYSIRHCGNLLVKEIQGSYPNVLGLPIAALQEVLLNFGIDLWDFAI
ncbi:Maf family nucleotide pyrophosphatase [Chlamydiifrater phoenicopteri]|uniref:Maf family nucleotide pyrophosphatase n=1 Tax=Chlamydiifrater phoenicopteri TaxID=2681469 RepID=UPI001BD09E6E|nr:Maf family nucleotide pyrophosphatase [Chlamydiifrater phoenicopteri]